MLNELKPKEGSVKARMRVGRGIGCTKGKTCGSGVKGQKSRTGVAINGFEGGQMPLYRRMPKQGFTNIFAKDIVEVSLAQIQHAIDNKTLDAKAAIDEDTLVKAGVVRRKRDGIKLISTGEIKSAVTLKLTGATKGAAEAVAKAGGKVEIVKIEKKLFGRAAAGTLVKKQKSRNKQAD